MYRHHSSAVPSSREGPLRAGVRQGAVERLIAALAERSAGSARHTRHGLAPSRSESDAAYFRRRSEEESDAVRKAAGPQARKAHAELARRYARLSAIPSAFRGRRSADEKRSERKRRQSELLDEALMATFPASDPVSVAFVR